MQVIRIDDLLSEDPDSNYEVVDKSLFWVGDLPVGVRSPFVVGDVIELTEERTSWSCRMVSEWVATDDG